MSEPGTRRRGAARVALRSAGAAVLATALASCQRVGESTIDILAPTERQVSFSAEVQPILTQRCAIPGCHVATGPSPLPDVCPADIPPADFESGKAYANLVGQRSCESSLVNASAPESILNRVEPAHPDRSYLFLKITGCNTPGCYGSPMPQGLAPLGPAETGTIQQWIEQGAQEN